MDILVIGNGFDLAHGVPTRYVDFLYFVDVYKEYYECSSGEKRKEKMKNAKSEKERSLLSFFEKFRSDNTTRDIYNRELQNCVIKNVWVEYFETKQKELIAEGKENWIDFESEISSVVQMLDEIHKNVIKVVNEPDSPQKVLIWKGIETYIWNKGLSEIVEKSGVCNFERMQGKDVKKIKKKCSNDLNKLIRALEIYLIYYVDAKIKETRKGAIRVVSKLTETSDDLKVLSFNYTDTHHQLYGVKCAGEMDDRYDFIHGKADEDHDVDTCNMVLGIDEYLPDGERDSDNEFIQFKKFYQRIFKGTGNKYISWLGETYQELNIYFFGHSLDVTDKDIIAKLILAKDARTTIYYHDKDALGSQIANLVKVIGEEKLITMTGTGAITFKAISAAS